MNFIEAVTGLHDSNIQITDNRLFIKKDESAIISINCLTADKEFLKEQKYSIDKFSVALLRNEHVTFIQKLVSLEGGKRIGYIFNINAISLENSSDITDKWERIYLHAALDGLIKSDNLNGIFEQQKRTLDVDFGEIIADDNIFILCLGNEALNKHSVDINQVKINLCAHGFVDINSDFYKTKSKIYDDIVGEKIPLKKISSDISHNSNLVKLIFDLSINQKDSFSKFFTLYQVIEVLISEIFPILLESSIRRHESNPRDLSNSIQKISTEKERIKILYNQFVDMRKIDKEPFVQCEYLCNKFLDKIDPKLDSSCTFSPRKESWAEIIYETRNKIVHTQSKLLERNHDDFIEIAYQFKLCCIEIISFYSLTFYKSSATS